MKNHWTIAGYRRSDYELQDDPQRFFIGFDAPTRRGAYAKGKRLLRAAAGGVDVLVERLARRTGKHRISHNRNQGATTL